ncbi:unnamed protein product [Polarella glacialis]|uniref:N-acetyltransferase domain-containing protein n=1 Tax=Polarella glacialis TaxID=89957 RepID=A0A813LPS2_POLGL|nr:unnamed protein product [Polarella glacialis]
MVPSYHAWMQDPELLELTGSEPLSLEEEYEMQSSWCDSDDKLTFIVLDRSLPAAEGGLGSMAGDVNVFFNQVGLDEDQEVEEGTAGALEKKVSYAAGEIEVMVAVTASRRRGLAGEALRLMAGYCAQQLGTRRFVAKIKDHNSASIALFESLGFQFVRHVQVFSEVVYQLDLASLEVPLPVVLVGTLADGRLRNGPDAHGSATSESAPDRSGKEE